MIFRKIVNFIFPPKCLICDKKNVINNGICYECFKKIKFLSRNCCKLCGYQFEINILSELICPGCVRDKPLFSELRSVFFYDENSSNLIKKFKYYDRTELAKYLAEMMYNYDQEIFADIDYITSVPLHWLRQMKRLYNQSSLLALNLSKISGKKFLPNLVKRVKFTKPQFQLTTKERKINLHKAFKANHKYEFIIQNKNILLIDDVYTTGQTIEKTVIELLKLKVNKIKILTLARTKF